MRPLVYYEARDKLIYQDYVNGLTKKELMKKYDLCETSIRRIINRGKE